MVIVIVLNRRKPMKYSRQREALLDVLKSTTSHPTAYWVYEELKKDFPNISLGTVYRNLALLTERGDILKLDVSSGMERYDGFTHKHSHFVCRCCQDIIDISLPQADKFCDVVSKETGCDVESHSLTFYGLCNKCKSIDIN